MLQDTHSSIIEDMKRKIVSFAKGIMKVQERPQRTEVRMLSISSPNHKNQAVHFPNSKKELNPKIIEKLRKLEGKLFHR